jgi:hypothetical protein
VILPLLKKLPLKLVNPFTISELKVGLPYCATKVTWAIICIYYKTATVTADSLPTLCPLAKIDIDAPV